MKATTLILKSHLFLLFLLPSPFSLAEFTTGTAPTSTAAQGVPQEQSTPTTQQPTQPQGGGDRKDQAKTAQAMAAAAAAMQGMSCMMMMNEARKMPAGSEKNMTMMMAMQQCAQAAQTAANAAKNEDAKKALGEDIPKMAQFTPPKPLAEQKPSENPTLPQAEEKTPEETPPFDLFPEPSVAPTAEIPEPTITDGTFDPGIATNGVAISALKPIENSKVDFNEGNKNDTPTITPPGGGISGGLLGFGKAFAPEEGKKLAAGDGGNGSGKAGRGKSSEEEASAGGMEGSSASKEEGGNSAFDALLNQLMGGAPPEGALSFMGGSGDLVAMPKDKATGRTPNIFEYASYRYRVAAFDDGRVFTSPSKRPKTKPATNEKASRDLAQDSTVALKK